MGEPVYQEFSSPGVSPTEERSLGRHKGKRILHCTWEDRYAVSRLFLNADGGFGALWPYDPTTFSRVVRTAILPVGADDGSAHPLNKFVRASVTLHYETASPASIRNGGGAKITEAIEPAIEFQTLGHKGFAWGSPSGDPLQPAQAPGQQRHFVVYAFTVHHATAVPLSAFQLMGHVNNSNIHTTLSNIPFPSETLLMLPTSVQHTVQIGVGETLEIRYRFSHDPTGWNTFFRKKTGLYERIFNVEGLEHKNYPLADLTVLRP